MRPSKGFIEPPRAVEGARQPLRRRAAQQPAGDEPSEAPDAVGQIGPGQNGETAQPRPSGIRSRRSAAPVADGATGPRAAASRTRAVQLASAPISASQRASSRARVSDEPYSAKS